MAAKAAVSSECCESVLTTESAWICGAPLPVMQVPRCQSQMTNLLPLFLFAAEKVVFGRPRGAPWRRFHLGWEPMGADITHSPGYGDPCMCISHGSASLSFSQGCPAAMLPIMSGGASWARQITFCASRNAPNLQGRRILRWLQLRKTGRWGGPRSREASSGGAMVRKSRSGSTGNFSGQIQQHDL
jgi:hypothetical protein